MKILINRMNVPPNPKNNMNAADDFTIVLLGHACHCFNNESTDGATPQCCINLQCMCNKMNEAPN